MLDYLISLFVGFEVEDCIFEIYSKL